MRRLPAVNLTTGNSCVLGFALYVFTYAYVHVGCCRGEVLSLSVPCHAWFYLRVILLHVVSH